MSTLRLMTYNVRYFGHGTKGVMSTRPGLRRIAATISSLKPLCDVVCLQEVEARSLRSSLVTWRPVRRRTQLQELMAELDRTMGRHGITERYQAHYFPAHTYRLTKRTALYTTGLAILVRPRLEIVSHNAGRVQDITHRRGAKALKQTRICAHISLRGPGIGHLDVFNTHLSLPGPFYREFWTAKGRLGFGPNQLVEAKRIMEVIRFRRRSEHMVLVGDFNSLPGSPVDRWLREENGLVDALAENKGLVGERLKAWSTAGFMKARMNIDRIYSSPSVTWVDFDGSAPFTQAGKLGHRFFGLSDHVPILGRLRLS